MLLNYTLVKRWSGLFSCLFSPGITNIFKGKKEEKTVCMVSAWPWYWQVIFLGYVPMTVNHDCQLDGTLSHHGNKPGPICEQKFLDLVNRGGETHPKHPVGRTHDLNKRRSGLSTSTHGSRLPDCAHNMTICSLLRPSTVMGCTCGQNQPFLPYLILPRLWSQQWVREFSPPPERTK